MNSKILAGALLMFMMANANAAGDPVAGKTKALGCGGCHGLDGNSVIEAYPKLAGQGERYIVKQLWDFRENKARQNPVMMSMAMPLSEQDMHDIGAYYQTQKVSSAAPYDENKAQLGKELYKGGHLPKKIPACQSCHGPTGDGNAPAGYPQLGGQYVSYTMAQLSAFKNGTRSNDENKVMRTFMDLLTEEDIEALAHYIASLK